ncbi:MAG: HAD-IA family hydrolase [Thermales bacterium]|nr:HAD-IA family hydrolase [Thermales bacterium]
MFDGGMASIDEQIAKPNPEFFKELIEHYSINPKESIFFDDNHLNVLAARDLGFWAKQYLYDKTNPSSFLENIIFDKLVQNPEPPKIIMLGKPNVGKSSLFNALVEKDIQIVTEIAGTTLSVNDYLLERKSQYKYESEQEGICFEVDRFKKYLVLDTTGIRKPGQRTMGVESFATYRSIESAHRSDVICFVMDVSTPITHQDQVVAGICQEAGKGIVLVLNKVDLIDEDEKAAFLKSFSHKFAFLKIDNVVWVSATKKIGLKQFWQKVDQALVDRGKVIPREDVRKLFNYLMKKKQPNKLRNKKRPVVYDLIYTGGNPPTFELLVKDKTAIHWSWVRFLENTIRKQFRFTASGLKVKLVQVDRKKILT